MPPLITVLIIGFSVAFISAAIIAPNLSRLIKRPRADRVLSMINRLKDDFGFNVSTRPNSAQPIARGRITNHDITVTLVPPVLKINIRWENTDKLVWEPPKQPLSLEKDYTLQIVIKTGQMLPPPLEFAPAVFVPTTQDRVRYYVEELDLINNTSEKVIFDDAMREDLSTLHLLCHYYSIYNDTISLSIRWRPDMAEDIVSVVRAGARTATWFLRLMESPDVVPVLLSFKVNKEDGTREKLRFIRLLINLHMNHPVTKTTLTRLLDYPDFDIGYTAAMGLHIDLVQYALPRLSMFDAVDKEKAARNLLGKGKSEVVAPLVALYHETREAELKSGLIKAFQGVDDSRLYRIFIDALRDPSTKVKMAAIQALHQRGKGDALAPLYAIHKDVSLPVELVAPAWDAIQAIRHRLGASEAGELSLAQPQSDTGSLSLAGDETEAGPASSTHADGTGT